MVRWGKVTREKNIGKKRNLFVCLTSAQAPKETSGDRHRERKKIPLNFSDAYPQAKGKREEKEGKDLSTVTCIKERK